MWSLLERRTQLIIIVGAGVCLAWACDAIYGFLTGQVPNNIKLISLIVFMIGVVFAKVAEIAWRPLWRRIPLLQRKIFPDLNGLKEERDVAIYNGWVADPMMKIISDFEGGLKKYPPIKLGTPDPYTPPQ